MIAHRLQHMTRYLLLPKQTVDHHLTYVFCKGTRFSTEIEWKIDEHACGHAFGTNAASRTRYGCGALDKLGTVRSQ